jgi:cell division protein FtsW
MGASSGLLPTKGLTLPFVSYGGSSLIANCVLLGIILRIAQQSRGERINAAAPLRKVKE